MSPSRTTQEVKCMVSGHSPLRLVFYRRARKRRCELFPALTPTVVEKGSQVNRFLPVLVEMYHFALPEGLGSPLGTVSVLGREADALPGTVMIITVGRSWASGLLHGQRQGR